MDETVLIVDDDAAVRRFLAKVVGLMGLTPAAVGNGRAAADYLVENGPPRLILLDLTMPAMGGREFWREMLAAPPLAHVPVVIISGEGGAAEVAREIGAAGCLEKPVALEALVDVVARLTGRPHR
jgi:CheY-like chemotaxis protein